MATLTPVSAKMTFAVNAGTGTSGKVKYDRFSVGSISVEAEADQIGRAAQAIVDLMEERPELLSRTIEEKIELD